MDKIFLPDLDPSDHRSKEAAVELQLHRVMLAVLIPHLIRTNEAQNDPEFLASEFCSITNNKVK